VKPGEKVAADGIILEGESYLNERFEISDQRPHLRKDRGRSNRSQRQPRWKDVLFLLRPLSANISVHDFRLQTAG